MEKYVTVDAYINSFSKEDQELLKKMRKHIIELVPNVVESISYGMPGYKLNGKPLVYFAAFKNHIGFYALPTAHEYFAAKFSKYKTGKGSVQFPKNQSLPLDLIEEVVRFRVENYLKS